MRGGALDAHMEVFTVRNAAGERREIVIPPLPPEQRIAIADELLN